ncbi:MAG: hypothetical protein Q7S27_04320 [Nanoarchaeota archaeon]|nr:hypothetical protein [Nanoarchaeota archaeon]
MEGLDELLMYFAQDADKIFREELEKSGVKYRHAGVRIYNVQSVGVQGDKRTIGYPCEVEIDYDKAFLWDEEQFIRDLSSRITNEVEKVNFNYRFRLLNYFYNSVEKSRLPMWMRQVNRKIFNGREILINKVLYALNENAR